MGVKSGNIDSDRAERVEKRRLDVGGLSDRNCVASTGRHPVLTMTTGGVTTERCCRAVAQSDTGHTRRISSIAQRGEFATVSHQPDLLVLFAGSSAVGLRSCCRDGGVGHILRSYQGRRIDRRLQLILGDVVAPNVNSEPREREQHDERGDCEDQALPVLAAGRGPGRQQKQRSADVPKSLIRFAPSPALLDSPRRN